MPHFQKPPCKLCAQCGDALVAAIWVEHPDERRFRNLWSCEACGYEFESTMFLPALDAALAQSRTPTSAQVH